MLTTIPFLLIDRLLKEVGLRRVDVVLDHQMRVVKHRKDGCPTILYFDAENEPLVILRRYGPKDKIRPGDLLSVGVMLDGFGVMERREFDDYVYAVHLQQKQKKRKYIAKHRRGTISSDRLRGWRFANAR